MQTENLIAASIFCASHHIEYSFISSLHEFGLIEATTVDDDLFIQSDDLNKLEQYTRFYYDLQINLEGIEVVANLLDQLHQKQREVVQLRNRLQAAVYDI
jgi:phage terminase large subunit